MKHGLRLPFLVVVLLATVALAHPPIPVSSSDLAGIRLKLQPSSRAKESFARLKSRVDWAIQYQPAAKQTRGYTMPMMTGCKMKVRDESKLNNRIWSP